MALDDLIDKLVLPTRDDLITQYKNDVSFRAPQINTDAGTLPDIDAAAIADLILPVYAESFRQAEIGTLDGKTGADLNEACTARGLPTQLPAAGASGFVVVATSSGGANVQAGDEIRNLITGFRYQSTVTGVFTNGQLVAVAGIDTGLATNVSGGTVLTWTSPRPGMAANAPVFTDSNGNGLFGGADLETEQQIRDRIRSSAATPAVSGNDAAYQLAAASTPGLAVEQAFTYPCILGPGVSLLVFLLRPSKVGGARIPDNAQIGLVKGYVTGQMPKDDSITYGFIIAQPVNVVLSIDWIDDVASWLDSVPWPPEGTAGSEYKVSGSPTATNFQVTTAAGSPVSPQVGQTVAVWDRANLLFRRKRILTVTGSGPWTLGIDTSNAVSDTSFVPAIGDLVSPWSESMNTLSQPFAAYFDTLGPGESIDVSMFTFYDDGFRMKRSPAAPQFWPNQLTTRAIVTIEELPAVSNAEFVQPTVPLVPGVGVFGTSVHMLTLGNFAVYPS